MTRTRVMTALAMMPFAVAGILLLALAALLVYAVVRSGNDDRDALPSALIGRPAPQTTLPALVVAHRLYGDATRADEITVRNNARHPGALRGGIELEVLSE